MKNKILLFVFAFLANWAKAQASNDYFSVYTPFEVPTSPIYVPTMPSIYDNSVTIINNSYGPTTPSITCTDSQKQIGQIIMIDTTTDKDSVVDAEVLFKSYSNNTASITITRLKLDGKWYPMDIEVIRLSSLLDSSGSDRNSILELLKNFNFFAYSDEVFFLF